MKFKLLALAALMAATGMAQAKIADSNDNGNALSGDMFASFYSVAAGTSFTVDLGLRLDQFTAAFPASKLGVKLVWDLDDSTFKDLSVASTGLTASIQTLNYGNVFSTFAATGAKAASDFKFDVKALDGLPTSLAGAGANRYLSTSSALNITATNTQVFNMDNVDTYVTAANADTTNSTHGTSFGTAGANMYDAGDNTNAYFPTGSGDQFKGAVSFVSTGNAAAKLNFFALTNTSSTGANAASVTKYAGQWSFDAAQNQLIYAAAAPVPEAETYAMLLAGLGLMGAVIRRRKQA